MAVNAKPIVPPMSVSSALSKQMRGMLITGTVTSRFGWMASVLKG